MALVLVSACGKEADTQATRPDSSASPRTASTTTTTTSTILPTKVLGTTVVQTPADLEVLQAYRSMWNAVRRALNPPDPDLPELAATHTGAALDAVRKQVRGVEAKGAVMRGEVELHPTLVRRTDTEATIVDCIVDHGHLIDPKNGNRLDTDQPDVVYNHASTTMVRVDGVWKRQASAQLADVCSP